MQDPEKSMRETARQRISAAMDGHATTAELEAACSAWRADGDARRTWHTYHLIGDVLRSDELASTPAVDEAFLQRLRQRLAGEPVALTRQPVLRSPQARWPWAVAAAAAGFAAVAAVMVVVRQGGMEPLAIDLQASVQNNAIDPAVVKGKLIRDAELERYFAAHRRVSLGATVVMPGAVVRSVEAVAIEEK